MRLEIWDGNATKTIDLSLPLPSPRIVVAAGEVEGRDDIEACLIDVENEAGEIARFWISVSIVRGRPKVRVATKPDNDLRTQVNKVSTGTFNIVTGEASKAAYRALYGETSHVNHRTGIDTVG